MLKLMNIKSACSAVTSFQRCASLGTIKIGGTGLGEPSAPVPGRNPLWTDVSSEIFEELKDGKMLLQHKINF